MAIDWAQHFLWGTEIDGEDTVDLLYRLADSLISDLLDTVSEGTTVMIVSDHGACPIRGKVRLNSSLDELGFLARANHESHQSALESIEEYVWEIGHVLPYNLKSTAKRVVPDALLDRLRESAGIHRIYLAESVDWSNTEAFTFDSMGPVYVNRSDQYPEDTVGAEEYDAARTAVAKALDGLESPESGENLVETVHRRDKLYHGPAVDDAPDLLIEPSDWAYLFYGDFQDPWVHEPTRRMADHHPEGVCIATGPSVQRRDTAVDAVDIAPSLLSALDIPLVEGLDGDPVLTGTDPLAEEIAVEELTHECDYNKDLVSDVEEQLSDFGYF